MKMAGTDQVLFHHNHSHTRDLFLRLNKLRHDNLLCDLTIMVQGQKFKAHKVVMAASSNYLLAAVRNEREGLSVADQADPNHMTIELDHVTTRGFAPLLDYAYTSELNVEAADVIDVLAAASYMQMFDVARACTEFMRTSWPQINHTPLVNLQFFANRSPQLVSGETSKMNASESSFESKNLLKYENTRMENVRKTKISRTNFALPFASQTTSNDARPQHYLSHPLCDSQALLSENGKENKSAETVSSPNVASPLFRSSSYLNHMKKENQSHDFSESPPKGTVLNITMNGGKDELQQDIEQAESTRNGNDRKTYDQIHRCSPIGNINNNNSNNNNNSASPIDASRKTFDETFSEDRPVNKDEVPEKNENEEKPFVLERPADGALDSWQKFQRRLYNLRQSELQTMWGQSNIFAAGQGAKTAEILRNALSPAACNRPGLSSRKDNVNTANLPNSNSRLSMFPSFAGLPFHRQFLQRQFLAHQQQQHSQPGVNLQQNSNVMFPELPAVPPSGQYTRVRKRTLPSNVPKPHRCEICGSEFTRYHNLKQHIKLHSGIKPYECDVCGKRFTRNYTLRLHKMKHIGLRNFHCGTCDAAFTSLGEFRAHLRLTMHSHFPDTVKKSDDSKSPPKINKFNHPSTALEASPNKFSRIAPPLLNCGVISPGSSGGGAAREGSIGTISPSSHEHVEAGPSPRNNFNNPNSPKDLYVKLASTDREKDLSEDKTILKNDQLARTYLLPNQTNMNEAKKPKTESAQVVNTMKEPQSSNNLLEKKD